MTLTTSSIVSGMVQLYGLPRVIGGFAVTKALFLASALNQWLIYSALIVIEDDERIRTYKSAAGKAPAHALGRRFGVPGRCAGELNRDLLAAAILALAGVPVRHRGDRPLWACGLVFSRCFSANCVRVCFRLVSIPFRVLAIY